jgi:hypothetical protein
MKIYRIEYQGQGLYRTRNENNEALEGIKGEIARLHPAPGRKENGEQYDKIDRVQWRNSRFFFTEKGYSKVYDYIQELLKFDGIEVIEFEVPLEDKRILWYDSKSLQVVFDMTGQQYKLFS